MTEEEKNERKKNSKKLADKKYYEANKEKLLNKQKKYHEENKDKIKPKLLKYYENNKKELLEKMKDYSIVNKEKIREYKKNWMSNKLKNDPLFKLSSNICCNIRISIKNSGFKKLSRTEQILGCTYSDFKDYIESKFEPWMNWDNYGNPKDGIYELNKTWDFDHIIAISTATNELDVIKLNHYTNFQPLCSYNNRFIKKNNPTNE